VREPVQRCQPCPHRAQQARPAAAHWQTHEPVFFPHRGAVPIAQLRLPGFLLPAKSKSTAHQHPMTANPPVSAVSKVVPAKLILHVLIALCRKPCKCPTSASGAVSSGRLVIRYQVDGSGKAIDYSVGHWGPLTHYLDNSAVPIDNTWVENQRTPIALGKRNWRLAGSLRAGQRAAAVISLLHSPRLNGHDVHAHMRDLHARLPMLPASRISDLFPQRRAPSSFLGLSSRGFLKAG
jgi:hypothetical protein